MKRSASPPSPHSAMTALQRLTDYIALVRSRTWACSETQLRNELTAMLYTSCAADEVRLLVSNGADVNARRVEDGITPLHVCKNVEVADALIAAGANIHAACARGRTPLYRQCLSNNVDIVKHLIRHGADVDPACSCCGNTPLSICRSVEMVDALLDAGAQIDGVESMKDTPFFYALNYQHEEVALALLRRGAHWSTPGKEYRLTRLWVATVCNQTRVMQKLIQLGSCVDEISEQLGLTAAFACKSKEAVRVLWDAGANFERVCGGVTPLAYVLNLHRTYMPVFEEVVMEMIVKGVDLRKRNRGLSYATLAIRANLPRVASILLDRAEVFEPCWVIEACHVPDPEVLHVVIRTARRLQRHVKNMVYAGNRRITPLQIVALRGFADHARALLEAGCDPDLSYVGNAELPLALAFVHSSEVAEVLLQHGADMYKIDPRMIPSWIPRTPRAAADHA